MTKVKKQLKIQLLILLGVLVITGMIFFSFLLGVHWQGTLGMKKLNDSSIKKLFCFGDNNLTETFQYNCYSPVRAPFKGFASHLECHVLTNHQMNTQSSNYNELLTIKADYVTFSLDFNNKMTTIDQSLQQGEPIRGPYKVVENNDSIVHGIRAAKLTNFQSNMYEFITVSKKTGKGMVSWTNTQNTLHSDDMIVEFFQCI